jgi:6-phosphofructokinase 1
MVSHNDLRVAALGACHFRSPLPITSARADGAGKFTPDDARVRYDVYHRACVPRQELAFEMAGARKQIFFDPTRTRAEIVICGRLNPSMNNGIRTLFFELKSNYGVAEMRGFRYGYQGLDPKSAEPPLVWTSPIVDEIQYLGGTILGTSRGAHDPGSSVDGRQDGHAHRPGPHTVRPRANALLNWAIQAPFSQRPVVDDSGGNHRARQMVSRQFVRTNLSNRPEVIGE